MKNCIPGYSRTLWIGLFLSLIIRPLSAQHTVTYAGGTGREAFYDAFQLSNGNFLVTGFAESLGWIPVNVPRQQISPLNVTNGLGTNKIGFILHLSTDMQTILNVVHFAPNAVEDIRFIKATNLPGQPTGDLFISGNTSGTKANNGGYFIGKLNNNFVNGIPTGMNWAVALWAEGYPKTYHPWDVGSDGKVVYIYGQSHAYDWAEASRLDANGVREVVPNWRYHKLKTGPEYAGPATTAPGGLTAVNYSSIIFKRGGRCDLRSWTQADYNAWTSDGNGRQKRGKWPLDFFFPGPCDPATGNTASGVTGDRGYTGYRPAATPIYGPSAVVVDRRNNHFYIGMNIKSVLPDGQPDFEPAVIGYDNTGNMLWWSRLYHETTANSTPQAFTGLTSTPDQYVDDLDVDYSQPASVGTVVVLARSHGNNVENLWEGNQIAATPGAVGFQNGFSGTNGNIHLSWLGKLKLTDGTLLNSTYLGEYNEGTNNYGSDLNDVNNPNRNPNLAGWPNPNRGWPNLNSTFCDDVQVAQDGSVCVVCVGRKVITTNDAFQQGVKPGQGTAPWSSFVRVYEPNFSTLRYSSLLVGQFDRATGSGGDNVDLFNVLPVGNRVLAVGLHKPESATLNVAKGSTVPTANVPAWGNNTPQGQSALLAYLSLTPEVVCESLRTGNWNDPGTWTCGREPTLSDVAIINAGHVVTVTTNTATAKRVEFKASGAKVVLPNTGSKMLINGGR
ncbi:MAG: hypothetical protein EAZ91_10640 [Cytophagales bacterium]|nr:MAG: hypothetical protein EAZ91_10640 [Cytophagales bacterium]